MFVKLAVGFLIGNGVTNVILCPCFARACNKLLINISWLLLGKCEIPKIFAPSEWETKNTEKVTKHIGNIKRIATSCFELNVRSTK